MASTYSPLLRIELMGTGDQANTWGVTTNENLGSLIEQAIAGAVTVNIPNSNVTLTELNGLPDQSRNMILVATGTLTAIRTIVAPETSKVYIVRNSTTGGFAINVQAGAGNSVTIPNGKTAIIYSDGVDFNSAVSYLLNADIVGGTVTGLDTPLAIADGGTGANNNNTARTNLEAAKSGVNSDITGLAALITPLTVAQGGTNASNANSARANLQAARSGANSDITSLTGLTTPLTPAQGGTGASSIGSAGAIMYSNGTNQVASNAPTVGQIPIANGSGVVSFQNQVASIVYVIDGGGAIYSNGIKGFLQIPFNCTITAVSLLADQTGSTVIDIWKDTYANFPPTVADSICASALPTIPLSATKSVDITLTGWTTTITAGDVLAFNVVSVTSITRVTITLSVNRT
jgi:hypothetical protein